MVAPSGASPTLTWGVKASLGQPSIAIRLGSNPSGMPVNAVTVDKGVSSKP